MRIPYVVSNSAKEVYQTSATMSNSAPEKDRTLVAEDFDWDTRSTPLPLVEWAAVALSKIFHRMRPLDMILQKDVNVLMDLYPADIPLKFSVPYIKDEQYWKRSFATKWPQRKELGVSCWKAKFLSVALQEYLENASADVFLVEEADELARLVSPYIFSLSLWQLQIVRPPAVALPSEETVEDTCPFSVAPCVDHIPLETVLKKLYQLVEISIVFGINGLEERYTSRYFDFSMADCDSLCKGLMDLKFLKIFRINRSKLDCPKVKLILKYLVKKETIEELDFSHCIIGDAGAKAAAGFLATHAGLNVLRLGNNKFGEMGVQGLAYALQMKPRAPLEILDLRMNTMTANSARMLASSLVRCKEKPRTLVVAACGLRNDSAEMMVGLLCLNRGLIELDLSANNLSGEAETSLLNALEKNRKISKIDLRNTRISEETARAVSALLDRNARLVGRDTELSDEIPPLYLDQPEYLVWDYSPDNPRRLPPPPGYPLRVPQV